MRVEFKVSMSCDGCVNAVRKSLARMGDVLSEIDIDLEKQSVGVVADDSRTTSDAILAQIQKTGKQASIVIMS